jgi:hypothetical protein
MLPPRRSLSGVFFRFKNPETGKMENRTFEDLPLEERMKKLENRDEQWLRALCNILADKILQIADLTGVTAEEPGEDEGEDEEK